MNNAINTGFIPGTWTTSNTKLLEKKVKTKNKRPKANSSETPHTNH